MWLRGSIYERIPQVLLVLGLLFMASAAYLDVTDPWAKLYFGTGVICFLWSLWVVTARLRHRPPRSADDSKCDCADAKQGVDTAAEADTQS